MRRLMVAILAGTVFSALTVAQAQQRTSAVVRSDDGRWATANRAWTASDVPPSSALYGISVTDSSDGKSAIIETITAQGSALLVGDRLDEIQLPGITDRERQANPGYWPYQVWSTSDFYRLAAKCLAGCLVRLRSGPRVFAYLPVGPATEFVVAQDADGSAIAYVDVRTGEQFGPTASAVLGRR